MVFDAVWVMPFFVFHLESAKADPAGDEAERAKRRGDGAVAVGHGSGDEFLVCLGGEEFLDLVGVGEFEFKDPSFAVGVGVDEGGVGFDFGVGFDNFSGDWGVDVGGGFDGFDDGGGVAEIDFFVEGGEFDEDDVGEFGLGVVGDANGGGVAFEAEPFVGGLVEEVGGDVHGGFGSIF